MPLGAGPTALARPRGNLLGAAEPGLFDQRANWTGLPGGVSRACVVVGLAGSSRLEAAMSTLGRARICALDGALVCGHRMAFGRQVLWLCRGLADRAEDHNGRGGTRWIPRLLPGLL